MSSVKLDTTKRNAVRLALVTGSTLAAIIGAQSLIALDSAPKATANASQADASFQFQPSNSQQFFSGDDESGSEENSQSIFLLRPSGQTIGSSSTGQSSQRRIHTRSSR
jgi:pyridoxine/pyridoxamine 5'-phosphate oxidase